MKSADTKRTVSACSKSTSSQSTGLATAKMIDQTGQTLIPHSLSLSHLLEISSKPTVTYPQTGFMTPVDTLAHDLTYVAPPVPYHSSELILDPNRINLPPFMSFQALRPILSF